MKIYHPTKNRNKFKQKRLEQKNVKRLFIHQEKMSILGTVKQKLNPLQFAEVINKYKLALKV